VAAGKVAAGELAPGEVTGHCQKSISKLANNQNFYPLLKTNSSVQN
jgi:hypothetical protein